MKAARILVLGVALAAGGAAAFLVGSGDEKKPEPAPAPVVTFDTTDVLIAKSDIGMGTSVSSGDLQWQAWPAATTGASYITKKDKPNAIEELTGAIARAPFAAGEPIRDAKLIKAKAPPASWRRSCRPACAPSRPKSRRKPAPAASSCRTTTSTSSCRAATRRREATGVDVAQSAKPS